jgi:AcrR family transcriptional regulator
VNVAYSFNVLHGTTRTPRARRHDANLHRILEAAMEMVAAGGLEALSMTRLADAVDYTPGALYRYFGSKDALLSKLVARILEDVRGMLDRALELLPASASPLTRVLALVQGYRAYAQLEPHRFGLLAMTMAEPRVLLEKAEDAEPVMVVMLATLQPLAGALADAAAAEQLDGGDVYERTLCLLAMLQGLFQMQKHTRYAPSVLDIDRLTLGGTRSLLLGWGGKPRTVDAAITRVAALGDLTRALGGAR